MTKATVTLAQLAIENGQKMTIEQMKYIKGGDGAEGLDDEKRRQRPGGGGSSAHRPGGGNHKPMANRRDD